MFFFHIKWCNNSCQIHVMMHNHYSCIVNSAHIVVHCSSIFSHYDVIKWKHFPRYWHLCGEFTGLRWIPRTPVTRGFGVFLDLRMNKRLSKQPWGWWFQTLSRPLWRHCNGRWITFPHLLSYIRDESWLITLIAQKMLRATFDKIIWICYQ